MINRREPFSQSLGTSDMAFEEKQHSSSHSLALSIGPIVL